MKIRLHVNRFEIRKGRKGWPWTLHTSKKCIRAKEVEILVPLRTEFRPDFKSNPKVFLVIHGKIKNLGRGRFQVVKESA